MKLRFVFPLVLGVVIGWAHTDEPEIEPTSGNGAQVFSGAEGPTASRSALNGDVQHGGNLKQ